MNRKTIETAGFWFDYSLTMIFILLKLTATIAWSWWWIMAPTLLPFIIAMTAPKIADAYTFSLKVGKEQKKNI